MEGLGGRNCTLHEVRLPEQSRGGRTTTYVIQIELERAIYGADHSGGAVYKLLFRHSLLGTTRMCDMAAVSRNLLTQEQYTTIISSLGNTRARKCNLIPLAVACMAVRTLGDGERTRNFLACFNQPIPRLWELRAEAAADEANEEVDLCIQDAIDNEEETEAPLHAELLHTMVPNEETPEEKELVKRWKLDHVPQALVKQLESYRDWRLQPLNFQRSGNAVVDITADGDKATVLRFLAFCKEEHNVVPSMSFFGSPDLAIFSQEWLTALHEKGLMWSSLGNYMNGLCNVASYWWDGGGDIHPEALQLDPSPPSSLFRLRSQCESQMKQQQLYAKKPKDFLEWDKVSTSPCRSSPLLHVWCIRKFHQDSQPHNPYDFTQPHIGARSQGQVCSRMGRLSSTFSRTEARLNPGISRPVVLHCDASRS